MNPARQPFGELLRQYRLAAGVSQEELAERARLSVQTISALERGVRLRPYRDTIALLSDALRLSQDARAELERAALRRGYSLAALAPPSGSVTFLFTTIAGDASRWESKPDPMAAAVARHDELVRSAIEAHGGYIFKTIGEEFCAAFARVEDAAAAAVHAQRALTSEDFRAVDGLPVQIALHTGQAEVHDGNYVGPALGRISRLLEVAHGGQILVSAATTDLLRGNLPEGATLHDLGPHRLRDLARSESVYQLRAPGIDTSFPPPRSLESLPNNLPTQLSSFIGRENDVVKIEQLIAKHRLVTLVGAGGIGKTRIALHVAADLLDGSGEGVWFVDFASLTDASLVPNTIASALAVQELPNRSPLETLIAYLKNKHLLLVLDNCEHLIDGVARAVEGILQPCSRVHVLATSRQALAISGERIYHLPSLSVPPPDELPTLNVVDALQYEAIALFVDRAAAATSRFALTEQLIPIVAEICRRLDGIALAIELAAARVNVLSATTLAEKLNERFLILTGGSRTALPRHKTMRALLDWSYDLLEDREQGVFRKLSIFAGGFTLELATALCAAEGISECEVLDLLASLVDKSLVQAEVGSETTRYALLESTRQYAHEKLQERGEYAVTARAHALALLALAERFDSALDGTPDRVWTAQVQPEVENWRTALEWALGPRGDLRIGQRLAGSLVFWFADGTPLEGRRWVRAALETCDDATPPSLRAKLELAEARIAASLAQSQTRVSQAAAERAFLLYEQAGDRLSMAEAQLYVAFGLICSGRIVEGECLVRATLAVARTCDARRLIGPAIHVLAQARYLESDLGAARSLYREALAVYKGAGRERTAAMVAVNLAEAEFQAREIEPALQLGREALEILRANNRWVSLAGALCNCSAYLVALTRFEEARSYAREGLALARDAGFGCHIAWALQHLAAIAALRVSDCSADPCPNLRRAARVLGFVDARFAQLEAARQYTEQQEYDRMLPVLRNELGTDLDELMKEGAQWSEDQAVAEALEI